MNFNPLSDRGEETSFEQGMPVTQAAKNAVKAVSVQADDARKKTTQDILAQFYGSSTDETNTQQTDHTGVSRAGANGQSGKSTNTNPNQTPEEQAKMERIRRELSGNYSAKFKSAPNGPFGLITDLDQGIEKARRDREQKEMQRKQDDEEKKEAERREKEAQEQELVMPAGKKVGFQMGKKQQQPIALRIAETKTEIHRGSTG